MDYNDAEAYDTLSHPYETFFSNLSSVTCNTADNQFGMHWSPTAEHQKRVITQKACLEAVDQRLNQTKSLFLNGNCSRVNYCRDQLHELRSASEDNGEMGQCAY
jgi:hypothetical protein